MSSFVFAEKVLDNLIDRYENTAAHITGAPLLRSLYFTFSPKTISEYYDDTSALNKQRINQELRALEDRGFVQILWVKHEKDNLINKVRLNDTHIDDVYTFLCREPKRNKDQKLMELVNRFSPRVAWEDEFKKYLIDRLQAGKGVASYVYPEDLCRTQQIFRALQGLSILEEETPKRVFSANYLGDSKALNMIEGKLVRILRDFSGMLENVATENVLSSFGIADNPQYILVKGDIEFVLNNMNGSTAGFLPDVGLSVSMVQNMDIRKIHAKHLLTVENLTTYHQVIQIVPTETIVIYLGGYIGKAKAEFIRKLIKAAANLALFHWGDVDYGGFTSFLTLEKKAGAQFVPVLMDKCTLNRYIKQCLSVDPDYAKRLELLLQDSSYARFHDTIKFILDKGIRLEQEVVDVRDLFL